MSDAARLGGETPTVEVLGIALADGATVKQMAAQHGVSPTTVRGWLRAAGLPTPAELHSTLATRLRTSVRRVGECLLWTAGVTPQGYPTTFIRGAKRSVTHYLLEQADRPVSPGHVVRMTCGRRLCVHLQHLYVVRRNDLPVHMADVGITAVGERHWNARLTWQNVDDIRDSTDTSHSLADKYGVKVGTIRAVRAGRTWNNEAGRHQPSGSPISTPPEVPRAEPQPTPTLLTSHEVAELFAVNLETVARWARSGKLSTVRILGGHYRFLGEEINRLQNRARSDRTV